MNKVFLSVITVSYNHESYIRECLDGVIMQKTNFAFEVIIGDDASTDNTQNIILEYQKKYPDIIKPILRTINVGANDNFNDILSKAQGKYIALCEGDDYWTDPYKLQKQVDFLETHKDYIMCFTNAKIINDPLKNRSISGGYPSCLTFDDYIWDKKPIPTLTVMFRNTSSIISTFIQFVQKKKVYYGDLILFSVLLQHGNAYFLDEVTATYRANVGVLSKQNKEQVLKNKIYAYKSLNLLFNLKYKKMYNVLLAEFYAKYALLELRRKNIFYFLYYLIYSFKYKPFLPLDEWKSAYYYSFTKLPFKIRR